MSQSLLSIVRLSNPSIQGWVASWWPWGPLDRWMPCSTMTTSPSVLHQRGHSSSVHSETKNDTNAMPPKHASQKRALVTATPATTTRMRHHEGKSPEVQGFDLTRPFFFEGKDFPGAKGGNWISRPGPLGKGRPPSFSIRGFATRWERVRQVSGYENRRGLSFWRLAQSDWQRNVGPSLCLS